jgi:Ca2+/Na+ antiporter
VKFTRSVAIVLLLIYIFLWVLAFNGASRLIPVLAVPLVLALLVAVGVWLNRFMGITPRRQHFQDRDDVRTAPTSSASPAPDADAQADVNHRDSADPPE